MGAEIKPYEAVRTPKEGECWQKHPCEKLHELPQGTEWPKEPVRYHYTVGDYNEGRRGFWKTNWEKLFAAEREAVKCGCLVRLDIYPEW